MSRWVMDLRSKRIEQGNDMSMYGELASDKWPNSGESFSTDGLIYYSWNNSTAKYSSDMITSWLGSNTSERTESPDVVLPKEMIFNDDSLVSVVAYSVLFVIAAVGNMTVFLTLFRNRHRKSRVNLFIMHLSIADLIVTFIMLPIEIGWHLTVSWKAGDAGCRLFMFFRAFGFYLSSFVLIAISLDRYFAILHPLSLTDAGKRGKIMLLFAWIFSAIASAPQSVIFHQEEHPGHPWFKQCVTFNFFPTPAHELAYNLFNVITVYGLPLIVIIIAYSLILWEMSKKTRESRDQSMRGSPSTLRRSGIGRIERAKTRTLKMTIVIVLVFILCWTPYFVISAWWWFDRESASKLDNKIQRGLFIFAVSNSCMDPIVYGFFAIDFVREFKRCCCFWQRRTYIRGRPSNKSNMAITGDTSKTVQRFFLPGENGEGISRSPKTLSPDILACETIRNGTTSGAGSTFNLNDIAPLARKATPPHIAGNSRESCENISTSSAL